MNSRRKHLENDRFGHTESLGNHAVSSTRVTIWITRRSPTRVHSYVWESLLYGSHPRRVISSSSHSPKFESTIRLFRPMRLHSIRYRFFKDRHRDPIKDGKSTVAPFKQMYVNLQHFISIISSSLLSQ